MGGAGTAFEKLVEIVSTLRDPERGCPWDRAQTHESLRRFLIEEAYEAVEAIEQDRDKLSGELGDVLLQVLLHSQLAAEEGRFDVRAVLEKLSEKLISRHPHVFGGAKLESADEVRNQWENQKKQELKGASSVIDGVPSAMPSLLRAQLIGQKSAKVGFEWRTLEGVRDKVAEELREFLDECQPQNPDRERLEDEFGDILFSLAQLARRLELDAERTLHKAIEKYARRFREIERRAGADMARKSLEELDALWNEVKAEERR